MGKRTEIDEDREENYVGKIIELQKIVKYKQKQKRQVKLARKKNKIARTTIEREDKRVRREKLERERDKRVREKAKVKTKK